MSTGLMTHARQAIALAGAIALAAAVPVLAAPASITVSGDSKPSDCGKAKKADYAIELSGSLAGCWSTFVARYNCQEMNGYALYTELGREEFEGNLDGANIAFDTQYTFSGFFPAGSCPAPDATREFAGGCIHYITADDLTGVMRFVDVMQGDGAPHYFYEGQLTRG